MKILNLMKTIIFLSPLLLFISCTGAKMIITANNLEYPVSASQGLYDKNFKLYSQEDYKIVNYFDFKVSKWTILWTLIDLTKDPDISETLNKKIKDNNGDAIVNLKIKIKPGFWSVLSYLTSSLIIPCKLDVEISGEIVKVKL